MVGFVVAYGPLGHGLSVTTGLIAAALGLAMALLVHRSMTSRRSGRKWLFRFVWPARLLLIYLLLIVLLQLDATGALPAWRGGYGYNFDRLTDAISAHYPSLDRLNTQWDERRETYGAKAEQASNDEEFLRTIGELLTHLDDEHAYVTSNQPDNVSGEARHTGNNPVISQVESVADAPSSERVPAIHAEILPSGIGYIEIGSFAPGADAVARFNAALDELGDVPGLIIDVRRNGGGSSWSAHRVAGHFLAEPFEYAKVTFRHRLPHFGWVTEMTYRVRPRAELYTGPVVILTSRQTMGAAEAFVVAMRDSGRAVVVGELTAGAVGVPIGFNLPGGKAYFTVGAFEPLSGPRVEGIGIIPDIEVVSGREQIVNSEDVALMAAIDYLIQRM